MSELLATGCCCGANPQCFYIGVRCGCAEPGPNIAIHCDGVISENANFVIQVFGVCYEVDATQSYTDPQGLEVAPSWQEYDNCEECCPDCYQEFLRCGEGEPNRFCVPTPDCQTLVVPESTIVVYDNACWVAGGFGLLKFCTLMVDSVTNSGFANCQACEDVINPPNGCPPDCFHCPDILSLSVGPSQMQTFGPTCLGPAGTIVNAPGIVMEMIKDGGDCLWGDNPPSGVYFTQIPCINPSFFYDITYTADIGCTGFNEGGNIVFRWFVNVTINGGGGAFCACVFKGGLANANNCPSGPWVLHSSNSCVSPPTVSV